MGILWHIHSLLGWRQRKLLWLVSICWQSWHPCPLMVKPFENLLREIADMSICFKKPSLGTEDWTCWTSGLLFICLPLVLRGMIRWSSCFSLHLWIFVLTENLLTCVISWIPTNLICHMSLFDISCIWTLDIIWLDYMFVENCIERDVFVSGQKLW